MGVILGIGDPCGSDPAAALLIDGTIAACAEEERFTRVKHAAGLPPIQAIRYCLDAAHLKPSDVKHVAVAWNPALYALSAWRRAGTIARINPEAAVRSLNIAAQQDGLKRRALADTLSAAGFSSSSVRVHRVGRVQANAASAYLFSGFPDAGVMVFDGSEACGSMLIGEWEGGRLRIRKEWFAPHSLGLLYSAVTEYLGFASGDGEYKVMGMASYGDPAKADISCMYSYERGRFSVKLGYFGVSELMRTGSGQLYSKAFVERFGPPRTTDGLDEPYVHIAAAAQLALENMTLGLMRHYLGRFLLRHKRLCLAGGCALNVKVNQRILASSYVKRIFVQPAANGAGAALGAAAFIAHSCGDRVVPMESAYYGPEFGNAQVEAALKEANLRYEYCADAPERAAQLLAAGEVVGWFQGRMEFGPRGLGNRSILGNPAVKGTSRRINNEVKFREPWRPFCPSVLQEAARDVFGSDHPAAFMTLGFPMSEQWRDKVPEVVHVDGSARPQFVSRGSNPRFYELLTAFRAKTGIPMVINTSMNRKGEPIACTPRDALALLAKSGLKFMFLGDFLAAK